VVKPLLSQKSGAQAGNLEDLSATPDLLPMNLDTNYGAATSEGAAQNALTNARTGQAVLGQNGATLAIEGAVGDDPLDLLNNKASEQIDDAADSKTL